MRPGLGAGVEASGGVMKSFGSHSLLRSGHCQISIISSLIYKVDKRPTTSLNLFRDTWQLKKNYILFKWDGAHALQKFITRGNEALTFPNPSYESNGHRHLSVTE